MSPSSPRAERDHPVLLLGLVALAIAVRWSVIGRDALWLDEGYSWWDARQPWASLWSLVPTCDPHPPLYFALLHPWMQLVGDGSVAMRSLSTVFGIATIVVVYFAGRLVDRASARRRGTDAPVFGIGALAALLFAITPFQVYFSVEARPYALLCFGAALLTLACLRLVDAIETPTRRLAFAWFDRASKGSWAMLPIGALVVVWSNNTAVLLLGAVATAFIASWIVDRDSRSMTVPVVVVGVVVALLWAPDWPLLLAQAREVTGDFWIHPPSLDGLAYELHFLIGLDLQPLTGWIAAAMVAGVLAIGLRVGWRWAAMTGALAVLPIAYNVAISYAVNPVLIARALIGATPALTLSLAAFAMLWRSRWARFLVAILLIAVHAYALSRYLGADHVKEPWTPIVARLAAIAPGAPILVVPNELVLPLTHEANAQRMPVRVLGLPADYPAIDMKARYPSGKCAPSIVDQDLAPLLSGLADAPTVVLLTRRNNTYDPDEAVLAAMRAAGFRLQSDDVFQPGDLRILRFTH